MVTLANQAFRVVRDFQSRKSVMLWVSWLRSHMTSPQLIVFVLVSQQPGFSPRPLVLATLFTFLFGRGCWSGVEEVERADIDTRYGMQRREIRTHGKR